MRGMYENGGAELLSLFRRVKARKATTSLDMVMIDPQSPAARADWTAILREVLPLVDFFMPSAEELCCMIDPARYDTWKRRAQGGDVARALSMKNDVGPLAQTVLAMGAKAAIIKCGESGIYYQTAGETQIAAACSAHGLSLRDWSGQQGHEKCFRQDHIVSATGAGDVSIAAFLTAMLRGYGLGECVELAAAAGACSLAAFDPLSALEPLEALRQKIQNGWAKYDTNQ
jgi:sugar/nucleoside kinase (ribokinase family)